MVAILVVSTNALKCMSCNSNDPLKKATKCNATIIPTEVCPAHAGTLLKPVCLTTFTNGIVTQRKCDLKERTGSCVIFSLLNMLTCYCNDKDLCNNQIKQ
uniref:Uncharacterized protein n=1 Tax=Acrobeloides nanus TaxID=290746 RepID=A0A914CS52_9BILA